MNAKTKAKSQEQGTSGGFDVVLWLVVIAIVGGGVYANAHFASIGVFYRALAGIAVAGVAAAIALQTVRGRATWNLAREARVEVRKVVWPTKQETTQTTLIVVAVVFLVGLLLWGLDSSLSWGVQAVIG